MKALIIGLLALTISLSSAFAQTAPRTLTMSGLGEVRAAPDMVTLSAGVSSQAPTAAAALSANSSHMQSVFAALKKLGVAEKDMQTSNFSVSPQMTGGVNGQPARLTGYEVNNQLRVRLDDVGKLGAALDALVTAGANQMNGIDFSIKEAAPLLAQARAGAVADAQAKAQIYAKAAGVSLGPILSISENDNEGPRPLYRPAPMMMAAKAVPVATGRKAFPPMFPSSGKSTEKPYIRVMENPFFEDWTGPFGAPPLDRIKPEHFAPAYAKALAEHDAEIAAIAVRPASFENTIIGLEKSGKLLGKVEAVFSTLASSNTNDALQAIELEMAPTLSAHWSAIYLNAELFARIDKLYAGRDGLGLDSESLQVLERYHLDFVRQGAKLKGEARARLDQIGQRLATLGTEFSQNVLADEQDFVLPLQESQMGGVPQFACDAAAATAQERGLDAPFAVTLSRSSVEPLLQFAADRGLREQLFKAWVARGGNDNAHNNKTIIAETLTLRAEKARLLGYKSYADYKLADSMAGTPGRARALLDQVWAPAKRRALEERDALAALIAEEGGNFKLAPWDWRYYAEKLREQRYDFDEAALKPYFELEHMIQAAFFTAGKLFGLGFAERHDIPVYHPDLRVWEVTRDGETIGLFYGDYFARAEKQGGAWMSSLRDQEMLDGKVLPLILNNCNFVKSDPALLSFDDARTLFHEFGHALHGMLSRVRYPRLSGTNVARDFVELPSQLYEHWLEEPQVLERFARHYQTGEALPKPLLDKLLAARNFNQGFATVEFLASAFVDMDFHALEDSSKIDPDALQAASLARIGMPGEIAMRHASPHFSHVFSGDGYSAGYYSYLWSEVLDADGFGAFQPDPFDPLAARRLHDNIYASGGTRDFAEAYRDFRGRDPDVKALLEGRGLETA